MENIKKPQYKLVLENLNKYYNHHTKNEVHVINNTNLSFESTGLVCLLGESGSGKTTLLNVISGIDKANSGKIIIDGVVQNYNSKASEDLRNNKFAYVFQNYYMINNESVYDNLRLALAPYHLSEEEVKSRIEYVLESVNMKRYIKRHVNQLSGGQMQRVSIARALIKNPEIIFCDEPTGNLDESTTLRIMTILKKISKNCLVVLATHEKRIASFFGDRIINISDGKVIKDEYLKTTGDEIYNQIDDKNIYLKEYNKQELKGDNFNIDLYSKDSSNDKVNLQVVLEHGKYYIVSDDDSKVEVVTKQSSINVLDTTRPIIDQSSVESFDYTLEKPSTHNNGLLSFKDFVNRAFSVSRSKSFNIIIIALILISCLFMITVGDFMTVSEDNVQSVVKSDSRSAIINLSEATNITMVERRKLILEYYNNIQKELPNSKVLPSVSIYSYLSYEGITQVERNVRDVTTTLTDFSYTPIELLDESTLIAGRMPERMDEVVADRWVLEKYMAEETVMSKSYSKPEAFLNNIIKTKGSNISFKIVGVCESNNMSIYANERMIINAATNYIDIALLSDLKMEMPEYSYLSPLAADESMYRIDANYDSTEVSLTSTIFLKVIKPRIDRTFSAKLIISDEAYEAFKKELVTNVEKLLVFTDDKETLKEIVDEVAPEGLQVVLDDEYTKKSTEYYNQRTKAIITRSIVTLMIFIVCSITLFITMKSHANENMQVTMVYRLLGIKKREVIKIYASEILVTSLLVMIPSSLITIGILKFISALPALNFNFVFTLPAYLISFASMLIINVLVGILPVVLIMKKTPAELVANYDL